MISFSENYSVEDSIREISPQFDCWSYAAINESPRLKKKQILKKENAVNVQSVDSENTLVKLNKKIQ
jgi:hypothetical protein